MSNETYVECLVKAKQSPVMRFLTILLGALTVIFAIGMLVFPVLLLIAVVTGVAAYFVNLTSNLEYEYLYLDRELSVDKIMARTRRKRIATYSVDRMEVMAPIKSYHLDDYKNRSVKTLDYSIREEQQPDRRYAVYYEGGIRVILSPSEEIVKALKNVAPRKIYTD